jgi:hypothetical protein
MLHFPQDRENTVFIGVCDWGMTSWEDEDVPSNYGKNSMDEMNKHKAKYNCVGHELFHVRGQRGTSISPMRMARKHRHTFLSESFLVGALAKKIYHKDSTSPLFQLNRDPNGLKMRFEVALDALTKTNPAERSTITHIVNMLKSPPYNMANPTMCFRDTAKYNFLVSFASILNHTNFVTAGDVNKAINFSYKTCILYEVYGS